MSANELHHWGVRGMRWGQRRAAAKAEKFTRRAEQDKAQYKYDKANEPDPAFARASKKSYEHNKELAIVYSKISKNKPLTSEETKIHRKHVIKMNALGVAGGVAAIAASALIIKSVSNKKLRVSETVVRAKNFKDRMKPYQSQKIKDLNSDHLRLIKMANDKTKSAKDIADEAMRIVQGYKDSL